MKRPITRKMKLTMVRDTVDGIDRIGCRATGIHKGHHIERTAWQPVKNFTDKSFDWLETLAKGRYAEETRIIDGQNNKI